jgi:hypothetical protein
MTSEITAGGISVPLTHAGKVQAAVVLARRHADVITTEQRKDKRGTRIYADVMRNAYAQRQETASPS